MNYFTEFDLYVDIVFFVNMLCVKIYFFQGSCEKMVKSKDAQGSMTNR